MDRDLSNSQREATGKLEQRECIVAKRKNEGRSGKIVVAGSSSLLPRASHGGELKIVDLLIPCAVLDGGHRLLNGAGISTAFGRHVKGGHAAEISGVKLPPFLAPNNLKPYIENELSAESISPVEYIPKDGRGSTYGYKAELLPKFCNVWLAARAAGALKASQLPTAARAEILVRGLAVVGINALVDEATGYQSARPPDDMQMILRAYVADAIQKYICTFPAAFYQEMFRLKGWTYTGASQRPMIVGYWTNDLVYDRLAPNVREALQDKNPVVSGRGRRKAKHHQFLTPEYGRIQLQMHLARVVTLMECSDTWGNFLLRVDRHLPKFNTTPVLYGLRPDDDDVMLQSKTV